jgi:uncharacterized membrane protein
MRTHQPLLSALAAFFWLATNALAQTQPEARILQPVDETNLVTLSGNVHPALSAAAVSAALDPGTPMERMVIHLKASAAQEAQLAQLVADQHDPKSPLFHQFLSPSDFGSKFGAAAADIAQVTAWLQSHGFTINDVPAGNRSIIFSGTTSQVTAAFHTEIRSYSIGGVKHIANATDPQIPAALASVVGGIVQLHDFQAKHSATRFTPIPQAVFANPQYTSASGHFLSPADYATIYDLNPLYSAGINGTGQSIAIISRNNITIQDVTTFRSTFALPPNDPQIVIVDVDPGITSDDSVEATIDAEWAGAVAPKATVKLVVGRCTSSSDGVMSAEIYAVTNNVAPIISVSYGMCEAEMGSGGSAFYTALWQQAAAQGQSVFIASGDSGVAGCNGQNDTSATTAGINGICSSPYNTCVGGTQFADTADPGQYWLPGNNTAGGSAVSYIPETTWNESALMPGGSGLYGGTGGPSLYVAKPNWQAGLGVPNDGKRDTPDVSLSAAQHDGYAAYDAWNGGLFFAGGTSFSTPAFAGIMALINQKSGAPQGLANPTLYALAAKQNAGGAAIFHDITTGNNSVPGVTGYSATPGYDMATGLGTVDAAALVNHWADAAPSLLLSAATGALSLNTGQSTSTVITTLVTGTMNAAVKLTASGAPAGVTVTFSSATIAAPGSGKSTITVAASSSTAIGNYNITITATGGTQTATLILPLAIATPTFTMVANQSRPVMNLPSSLADNIVITAQTGFSAALTFTLSGAPAGVTASLSKTSLAAPGSGTIVLNLATNTSVYQGNYPLVITGTGGGQIHTITVLLVIPSFTVATPAGPYGFYKVNPGSSVNFPVTITPDSGFGSSITVAPQNGYLPSGAHLTFSATANTVGTPSYTVSGSVPTTIYANMAVDASVPLASYFFNINGNGGNVTSGTSLYLLNGVTGSCQLDVLDVTHSTNNLSVNAGSSVTSTTICSGYVGNFPGALALSYTGAPAGMTFTPSGPMNADTWGTIRINVAQSVPGGTYGIHVYASSGGFTAGAYISVIVTPYNVNLAASQSALSLFQGASGTVTVTSKHQGGFNSPVSLAWSGLPTGLTAALSSSSLAAPGDGTAVTTFTAAATTPPGTYTATLTASGAGATQTVPVALTIAAPSCTLAPSAASLALSAGLTGSLKVSCNSPQGTFSAPLTLALSGAPNGVTATTSSNSLTVATGSVTLQVATPITLAATSFNLSLAASSGSFGSTLTIPVSITASNFTLTAAQAALSIYTGGTGTASVTTLHHGIFNSAVSLAWSGLPNGVTAALAKATIAAPGDATVATTFNVASTTTPGTYNATLTATGGGITQTIPLTLTIATQPACTLAATYATTPMVMIAGNSYTIPVTCGSVKGTFPAPLNLTLTGAPAGITAALSAGTITAGGNAQVTVTLPQTTPATTLNLTLQAAASSVGFTQTLPITAAIHAYNFNLTAAQATLTIKQGASATENLSIVHVGAFNSAITLTWSGLPAGVSATNSVASTAAPGDGTPTTTLAAASTAKVGTYSVTLTGTGGGVTQVAHVNVVVASK